MKRLIVIVGPTAIGKTSAAIALANTLKTEIVSCDSRQFYSEMNIGVARPTPDELSAAKHHFIACRSVQQPYNAFTYGEEALTKVEQLFESHDDVVAVGGSGLYIDALCQGINLLPDPTPELRERLSRQISNGGLPELLDELRRRDPDTYATIDRDNPIRVQRAMEVILTSGRPYSELLRQPLPARPFAIVKIGLHCSRDTLRQRIDSRVDAMMKQGLPEEVRSLLPLRELPTLHTVGYQELFPYIDGTATLQHAVTEIKNHTWQYAKKQMNWFRRYKEIRWVDSEKNQKKVANFFD